MMSFVGIIDELRLLQLVAMMVDLAFCIDASLNGRRAEMCHSSISSRRYSKKDNRCSLKQESVADSEPSL